MSLNDDDKVPARVIVQGVTTLRGLNLQEEAELTDRMAIKLQKELQVHRDPGAKKTEQ